MGRIFIILLLSLSNIFARPEILLDSSNAFLLTMRANNDAPIKSLLDNAKAIIIFPDITKIGLVIGGMSGDGIMAVKNDGSFNKIYSVQIKGGSIGLQAGYENNFLVLFIFKESLIKDIKESKITVGADASYALGDVAKSYARMSDFKFTRDIYAYANNYGFFAGASLGGSIISISNDSIDTNSYGYTMLMEAFNKF